MWHAAQREFLGKLAADPDPKDEPPFAEMVEAGDLLGDRPRRTQWHKIDVGAEQQPAADDRRLGELQERVEDRHREGEVIAHPQRIVAAAINQSDQLGELIDRRPPRRRRRFGATMDVLDADLERLVERQGHLSLQCALAHWSGLGPLLQVGCERSRRKSA